MWYNDYFCIPMTKCKSRKKLAEFDNTQLQVSTITRLIEEALDRYGVEGLPDTCNERVVLQSLLVYGAVTFFKEKGSILALPSAPTGNGFNIYGDPTAAWVFSKNGMFNKEVKLFVPGGTTDELLMKGMLGGEAKGTSNGVIVWENKTRTPFIITTMIFANAIADTMRTIDINRMWLKRPFIPVCEESLVPSVNAMFSKMVNNEEVIPVSTGVMDISRFDLKPIDVSPATIKAATELVEWYENKFREYCGTESNTQMDKKGENLIEKELDANDEYVQKTDSRIIDYLNEQFDFVNKVFGTNIKAVTRKVEQEVEEQEEGDEDNEDVSGNAE